MFGRKKKPYVPQGRVGVRSVPFETAKGFSYLVQYEVEELEQKGGYSRVKILSVSGINPFFEGAARDHFPKWVVTDAVEWFESRED